MDLTFLDQLQLLVLPLVTISVLSMGLIYVLSGLALVRRDFQFFPPPSKESWQHRTFLGLFRGYVYPLIIVTALSFEPKTGDFSLYRYLLGTALLVVGFGLAFLITFRMGWRNAFGEKLGLQTTGWFKRSRNPIYVATWVGLVGWAILANAAVVTGMLALWALMYVAAPFVEEPWLEQMYGDAYRDYKARTPRFL